MFRQTRFFRLSVCSDQSLSKTPGSITTHFMKRNSKMIYMHYMQQQKLSKVLLMTSSSLILIFMTKEWSNSKWILDKSCQCSAVSFCFIFTSGRVRGRTLARSRVRRCLWVSMSSGTPLRYWVTADGQVDFSEKRDCVHAPMRGRQISRADLVALNQSKNTRARRRVCLWCQSASSRLTEEVHVVTNWCASVKHAPSCGVKNTHLRLSPSLG